jgi:oligosaccharide repeat unit polymerase
MFIGKKIKLKKISRVIPYVKSRDAFLLLYLIIAISFLGAFFYNLPVLKAFVQGGYFGNRINIIYGRGYLGALGSLHGYIIPFILMVKFAKKQKISALFYLVVFISLFLTIIPMNRGPILTFFLTYLFIINDFRKAIPIKKLIKYGTYSVAIFGMIIPIVRGIDRDYLEILRNEIGIHTWNLSHYISMTNDTGFFGMKPITMALAIIKPGHQEGFVIWIKKLSTIDVNVGGASMSLIGEGFLEGGIFGVVINFFVLGLLIAVLYKQRKFSFGAYFIYLYFLNRTESIIQFGFSKILLTMIIVSFVLFFINLFKNNDQGLVSSE